MSQSHVTHIIDHFGLGGAQRVVFDLATRQAESGRPVSVICLRKPSQLSVELHGRGVPVYHVEGDRWDLRQWLDVIKILHLLKPEIVHLHLIKAYFLGRIAALFNAVPNVVIHDHESSAEIFAYPGPLIALRRLIEAHIPQIHVIHIVLSASAADYAMHVRRLQPRQIIVVANGIDVAYVQSCELDRLQARRHYELSEGCFLIVSTGRINTVKGFDLLVDAATMLPQNVQIALAGDGPQRAVLEAKIAAARFTDRFHLLGHLNDVRPLLRAADLYVQPSRRESFGLSTAEASASGLPVVASRVGGLRDIIRHGETGLLVQPENPQALAEAIKYLIAHPQRARDMGAAGCKHVSQSFNLDNFVSQIDVVYDHLLSKR